MSARLLARSSSRTDSADLGMIDQKITEEVSSVLQNVENAFLQERDPAYVYSVLPVLASYALLQEHIAALRALTSGSPAPVIEESSAHQIVQMTALFLRECLTALLPAEKEALVAGVALNDTTTHLDRLLPLKPRTSSAVHVEPDPAATYAAITKTIDGGQQFHALFHSHPGEGIPSPSGIDLATHQRLEDNGYDVIGGIFTAGGYVRFFSHHKLFSVTVLGERVERIDDQTFRLPRTT